MLLSDEPKIDIQEQKEKVLSNDRVYLWSLRERKRWVIERENIWVRGIA